MTEHVNMKELISRYVDGEVSSQERDAVEQILRQDASMRAYYEELTKLDQVLNVHPVEETSPDWEHRVRTRASLLEADAGKEDGEMKHSTWFKVSVGGGVLATVFMIVMGLQTYSQRSIQGRIRAASVATKYAAKEPGKTSPYEPYYLESQYAAVPSGAAGGKKVMAGQRASSSELMASGVASTVQGSEILKAESEYWGDEKADFSSFSQGPVADADLNTPALMNAEPESRGHARSFRRLQTQSLNEGLPSREEAEENVSGAPARAKSLSGYQREDSYADKPLVWRPDEVDEISKTNAYRTYRYDYDQPADTEEYLPLNENPFLDVTQNPLSTFSIDVDTASYANVRRYLNSGQLPPVDAVRLEEMINYFTYDYPRPRGRDPFSVNIDASVCPWNTAHQLVRIGIRGKTLDARETPPANLVFLIDVSGSMRSANKLPLLKKGLEMMVRQLSADQRIAIVVYSGSASVVLDSTPGSYQRNILQAIHRLNAGGSTAGGAGIQLAYDIAGRNFVSRGNNRVILATDGDFNVGVSSTSEMVRLIEEERKKGIFLTVLGFGTGNIKDGRLEQIADKGNGSYYYIDDENEARKVLVKELGSTLFTVSKDVKIQVEFNPAQVGAYRLIGYENRVMAARDFHDDTKDAGELGAGHTVTALYEIVPAGADEQHGVVDKLAYQVSRIIPSKDLMTVKLRYKEPDGNQSRLIQKTIRSRQVSRRPRGDLEFAAAVAEFGLLLRNSPHKGDASYDHVIRAARESLGRDQEGYRREFIRLVEQARSLDHRPQPEPIPYPYFDDDPEGQGNWNSQTRGFQFKGE